MIKVFRLPVPFSAMRFKGRLKTQNRTLESEQPITTQQPENPFSGCPLPKAHAGRIPESGNTAPPRTADTGFKNPACTPKAA